jgi:hypothetical protein
MAVLKRDFGPSELLELMQANGVDRCVAVQADPSEEETRFLLSLADTQDGIAGVVGWVDLCAQNAADRLERFAQHPKFKGVRHLVQSEPDPDFMLRADFKRGIKALAALGLTYDLLIKPHQIPAAIALVRVFPDQPLSTPPPTPTSMRSSRGWLPRPKTFASLSINSNPYSTRRSRPSGLSASYSAQTGRSACWRPPTVRCWAL